MCIFLLDLAHVPGSPSRPVCSFAWPSVSADIFSESLLDALTMESLYIPSRVTVIKRLARLRFGLCVCQCICSMFNLEEKEKRKRKNNSHCVATACLAVSRFRGEGKMGRIWGGTIGPATGEGISQAVRVIRNTFCICKDCVFPHEPSWSGSANASASRVRGEMAAVLEGCSRERLLQCVTTAACSCSVIFVCVCVCDGGGGCRCRCERGKHE